MTRKLIIVFTHFIGKKKEIRKNHFLKWQTVLKKIKKKEFFCLQNLYIIFIYEKKNLLLI
jgi:hypothetical protein